MPRKPLSIYMVCVVVVFLNLMPLALTLPAVAMPGKAALFRIMALANHIIHLLSIGFVLRYFLRQRRWAMFAVFAILLGNALYYLHSLALLSKKNAILTTHDNKLVLLFAFFTLNFLCGVLLCSRNCQSFFPAQPSSKQCVSQKFSQKLQQACVFYSCQSTVTVDAISPQV